MTYIQEILIHYTVKHWWKYSTIIGGLDELYVSLHYSQELLW